MALKRPMRLSPNDPDAAALIAKYPGRYEYTRGPMTTENRAVVVIFVFWIVMVLLVLVFPELR